MAGAAAGAGMIAAGNISAGSAAASVGGAVFLTGSLYVAEQAVSDAVSGRLGDTEKYVRKALAGSVVGFLTGASGLMMQGASLGKVLSLGFGEGFLGSAAAQGLLNEDGEINWALAIGDGMFSAVMAGLVWKKATTEVKINVDSNLKPGTLSNVEARKWYLEQETKLYDLIDHNLPLEQQARLAFDLRNQYRTQARELMADRKLAESLYKTDPNLTWEQIIQKQISKGLSGDDIYKEIIESSRRSRTSVNRSLV